MAIVSTGAVQASLSAPRRTNYAAMSMVTTLFFMWGFCTVLNDVLVPHLQSVFSLNYVQSQLIQLAFFSSYFVFAQPAGKLVEWVGYQRTMVIGLLTMGVRRAPVYPCGGGCLVWDFSCARRWCSPPA